MSEKKIPSSLKECYKQDSVAETLWNWSDWLDIWGLRVLILLIIMGIVATISEVVQVSQIDRDLMFLTAVTSGFSWLLTAFLEYCAYNILSALLAALATIVQNTKISANVALYNVAKDEELLEYEVEGPSDRSYSYSPSRKRVKNDHTDSFWTCNECGTKNNLSNICCKGCGKYK